MLEKSYDAFTRWTLECERQAVITVHLMLPDDENLKQEASKDMPNASVALDHIHHLRNDRLMSASEFWVAFHILQQTLVG